MEPTSTRRIVFFLILTVLYQAANAQTYSVTSNKNFSSVVTSGSCTGCIFNISSGVTLTFAAYAQCTSCTFNGGTVNLNSSYLGLYTGNLFENETVLFSATEQPQGNTFTNDSVSITSTASGTSFGSGTTTFTNSRISVNASATCQGCVFTNDSVHVTSGTFGWQSASTTISGSHFDITGEGTQINNTDGMTLTNSIMSFNSTSSYDNDGGTATISGSQIYLNDTSNISASSALALENSSELFIGTGSTSSHAYLYYDAGTAPSLYDNSMIKIASDSNSYQSYSNINYYSTTASTTATTINTQGTGINCGAAHQYSCATNEIFGCATINSGGVVACTTLALADISLTAVPAGANAVNLSWSDNLSATADHYLVQRSTDNGDWTTLATIAAGGYTAGDYRFEDPAAPTGTDNYRIARTDQNGAVLYSAISSVTIAGAAGAIGIGIYPNPVTGHTFFITTPNTEQLTVNIFTVTGQLLSRQSLQGQVQYQLLLPSRLLPGNAVIVQAITTTGKQAFPLLLQ
jgi:hypothetical protein